MGGAADNKVAFTVFTATYNRAHVLHRVYYSLCHQSFRDFEWLIVDDGSVDNTQALVEEWRNSADFPIRLFYQENQHKKTAFNLGVREARGLFFYVVDSDDELLPDALQVLYHYWQTIPDSSKENLQAYAVCV